MKTKLSILLLILTADLAFSQQWSPFVLNQNSYYKQQHETSAKVENFLPDSIRNNGQAATIYFNARSGIKADCYRNIWKEPDIFDWIKNPAKIDSLITRNDSVLFIAKYSSEPDTFVFKPLARLNDSWVTNGITIQCSELGVSTILGHQDSVKTFTCAGKGFGGTEFILSKNYGFIKFLPLNEFLYPSAPTEFPPYYELIGYSGENGTAGYTQPDFSAYFHLHSGDRLYWRDYSISYDIGVSTSLTYHVDSLKTAFISGDSVHYSFLRTDYNENGSIKDSRNYTASHIRKDEGVIVGNNTSWFGLKYDPLQANEMFFVESLYFKVEYNDTVSYLQYTLPGITLDTADCETGLIMDYGVAVAFSTREGKIFQGTYSWGESSSTLMGSVINSIEYGDTDIPIGIDELIADNIRVYPNPFTDDINVDTHGQGISRIEIIDCNGSILLRQETDNRNIDLSGLFPGLYILKITSPTDKSRYFKIIKQ